MTTPLPAPRECGRCTACCTAIAVPDLNKPPGVPCAKLRKNKPGCGIHSDRPASCRAFQCAWLLGWGAETNRPDKSGVVFAEKTVEGGLLYLTVFEMAADAAKAPWAVAVIQTARNAGLPVLVLRPGAQTGALLPPTGDLRPTHEIMAAMGIRPAAGAAPPATADELLDLDSLAVLP